MNKTIMIIKNQWFAIFLVAVFLMLTANKSLIQQIVHTYPLSHHHVAFVISLFVFFGLLTTLFITFISVGRLGKWWVALMLIIAAQSAYYMDHYGVIIDTVMIDNIVKTDRQEVAGLINITMLLRVCLLGIIPAWLVIRFWPDTQITIWRELVNKLIGMLAIVALVIVIVWSFSAGYASFIREHKLVRFYANPTYPVYSFIKYCSELLVIPKTQGPLKDTASDAKIVDGDIPHHELIVMVVGETARYDRFSLNGYHRNTNPRLSKESVVSFSNVSACGTSTGVSVPCMFSMLGREDYDKQKALNMKNVLDVLVDNGVAVLWRDNNSDSKGVATRIQYEDYKTPTMNPNCDKECRDVGMLAGLDQYIAAHANQDILIVLHQMGNHGPEYYRRYPEAFKQFKPECETGELQDCSKSNVDNSYDNAILYTDYFLSEVIQTLKQYDQQYETAMLYVSDHGESLGENGVYLHAAPYQFAPESQTHVPAILWVGKHFDYSYDQVLPYRNYPLSHDDLYCSLLIAYEIETHTCDTKHAMLMQNVEIVAQMHATNQ